MQEPLSKLYVGAKILSKISTQVESYMYTKTNQTLCIYIYVGTHMTKRNNHLNPQKERSGK